MFNTELGLFCYMHDNWEELLTQEPYYLKIKEDGPYVIFNYDQIRSDFNNPIVREARGIIFKKNNFSHPICWAFNKFGNYGESYVPDIDWSTAFVTEKIDGSLIKLWWDWDNGWHISTNGTIDAFKAEINNIKMPNFGTYFEKAIEQCCSSNFYKANFNDFVENLDFDCTYMFELVGPYNRVVIPYEEPAIIFLGARNKFTGEEFTCDAVTMERLGVSRVGRPAHYSLSTLDDCIKAAELKSWDEEGFVVCDKNFNRVKIKSPSYVLAHFMRNNNVVTRKHLIRVILSGEVEEFLCYAKDYADCLRDTQKLINAYYHIGSSLVTSCRKARNMSRSDYAELVKTFPKIFHGLLFFNYEKDMSVEEYTSGWTDNKWEEYLESVEKLKMTYFEDGGMR